MTTTANLTLHEQDNLRDACMSGLVPCTPSCHGDRTEPQGLRREFNGADWTLALRGAREWRRERVATLIRRKAPSLSSLAQDAGIVPGYGTPHRQAGCCTAWQQVNRDAAALIRWEWRSQSRWPETHDAFRYHLTAWATAR